MEGAHLENEQELAERAKTDDEAFVVLYEFYLPKIYGFVLRRCGHVQTAEDIVSTVFLKCVNALPKYRADQGAFGAWLYRIATNALIDHYRSAGRSTVEQLETAEELADAAASPSDLTETALESRRLRKILALLPPRDQEILNLKYFAGLSNQEIAETLGQTANNVGVLIHRALKKAIDLNKKYVR